MKIPFLPIHIETSKTYYSKLAAAKELGRQKEIQISTRQITQLLDENARMRFGRKLPKAKE
jgi:hypothetical protein